jgi:hypothetical protein
MYVTANMNVICMLLIALLAVGISGSVFVSSEASNSKSPIQTKTQRYQHITKLSNIGHISYDVDLYEHVIKLDELKLLKSIECEHDTIALTFDSSTNMTQMSNSFRNAIINGGKQWNCVNKFNIPSIILRHIETMTIDGNTLKANTIDAKFTECFENMNFELSKNPQFKYLNTEPQNGRKSKGNKLIQILQTKRN